MIKIMSKNFLIVFIILLFFSFIYIIHEQTNKLHSYELGNQDSQTIKAPLKATYMEPSIKTEKAYKSELNNFIECHKTPININEFSDKLKNKFYEIENHFKSSNGKVSFAYEDLYSGLHISYNEKQKYFAASTIKAPVVLYIYNLYVNNKLDLNKTMKYQPSHYVEGSGTIKHQPYGEEFTIKELTEKTIVNSDNIAYKMLTTAVNHYEIKQFWKSLEADTFWTNNNIWGQINSKDGIIYMKELYKFTQKNPEISEELLNLYFSSVCKLININDKNIKIAHKSGWNSASIHDMAIVYHPEPYVISINSLLGYDNYNAFFNKASNLINEFHTIYWNEKSNYCYQKTLKKTS